MNAVHSVTAVIRKPSRPMRTTPRRRHHVHPVVLALLRPALRYSYTREAYVLRGVGNHRGPVLVRGPEEVAAEQPRSAD